MMQNDEWLRRVTIWLEVSLREAEGGHFGRMLRPIADEATTPEWRWPNWCALTDLEVGEWANVRAHGCTCVTPLIGFALTERGLIPRCRLCNIRSEKPTWS